MPPCLTPNETVKRGRLALFNAHFLFTTIPKINNPTMNNGTLGILSLLKSV